MFSEKYFSKINKALGIELRDWQKAYIRGDSDLLLGGRGSGKTLAFVLRQLLNYEVRVPFSEECSKFYVGFSCDRNEPSNYMHDWYIQFVYNVARRLDDAGIETRFMFN